MRCRSSMRASRLGSGLGLQKLHARIEALTLQQLHARIEALRKLIEAAPTPPPTLMLTRGAARGDRSYRDPTHGGLALALQACCTHTYLHTVYIHVHLYARTCVHSHTPTPTHTCQVAFQ